MNVSTITTNFLFTLAVNYSKDQTSTEIISCTHYCATPLNQQPKESTRISTITTNFIFTVAVHSFKDQTMPETIYFTPYCATPEKK